MNEMNTLEPGSEEKSSVLGNIIKNILKYGLPLVIILIFFIIIQFFLNNEPVKKRKSNNLTPPLTVAVLDIVPQDFQVNIQTYGNVSPRTQSFLVSQVSGQITHISSKLREGSFFKKGDVLLRIDDRTYLSAVKVSEANLANAREALAQEQALSSQAAIDWKNLGNGEQPTDFVLRKPQLQTARAQVVATETALGGAKLMLSHTKIIAPYDGRVLNQLVDLGQVTNTTTQIAEIYATDYFEVRLPLHTSDLKFIDLPQSFRDNVSIKTNTDVNVYSSLTDNPIPWPGQLVRTESSIDETARQLHVIAQIDDPFNPAIIERPPLKIGEYVNAKIKGKTISDAIIIPSGAVYQNSYVYIVDGEIIKRKEVNVLWQDANQSLIDIGLTEGDRLVITTLGQIASGTRVQIEGEEPDKEKKNESANKENAKSKAVGT